MIKGILKIFILVLFFSGILDLYLWIAIGFEVPSWTISLASFGTIGLIAVILHFLKKESRGEASKRP